jgi:hypothetical protein
VTGCPLGVLDTEDSVKGVEEIDRLAVMDFARMLDRAL